MPKWLIILLAALYVVSPIDPIPDVIPFLGWIDDLIVIILVIRQLKRMRTGSAHSRDLPMALTPRRPDQPEK